MIIDLQRRLHEAGRIRIGQQVPVGKTGKTRPAKLDTFRLTSPDKTLIERAAVLYGGTPTPWQAPAGPQYEVITTATTLPVIVPPSDLGFSQHYELWSGGGCLRRCDGRYATYNNDNTMVEGECLCDPDNRECNIHTRLSVMLRDLVGLGLWRLDTQGWNAALELQGAVEILNMAAGRGQMLPAQLRLEQRMTKRPGQQTRRFAVPVLDVEISPAQLLSGATQFDPLDAGTVAIEAPRNNGAPLTPVPESVAEHPAGTIAEQIKPPPPPRRRGQIPIPATGLKPRTAAQASASPPDQNPDLPNRAPGQRRGHDPSTDAASRDLSEAATQTPPRQYIPDDERAALYDERPTDPHERELWDRDNLSPAADEWPRVQGSSGASAAALFPDNDEPDDDEPRLITAPQLTKLSILLKEAGFDDRDARHDFVAQAIGRHIDTAKELTLDEASRVIDILENG